MLRVSFAYHANLLAVCVTYLYMYTYICKAIITNYITLSSAKRNIYAIQFVTFHVTKYEYEINYNCCIALSYYLWNDAKTSILWKITQNGYLINLYFLCIYPNIPFLSTFLGNSIFSTEKCKYRVRYGQVNVRKRFTEEKFDRKMHRDVPIFYSFIKRKMYTPVVLSSLFLYTYIDIFLAN